MLYIRTRVYSVLRTWFVHFLDPDRIKIICINEKINLLKEYDFALIIQIYSSFDVRIVGIGYYNMDIN